MKSHLMRNTKTYASWADMKTRCNNPNSKDYHLYGGRGINYDPAWESFESFYLDMGEKPHGLTLDRIDNSKGYFKNNCRWASIILQATNKRKSKNNTSGYKGVSYVKSRGKWVAYIYSNKKRIQLGYFGEIQDAIDARKAAETKYHSPILQGVQPCLEHQE